MAATNFKNAQQVQERNLVMARYDAAEAFRDGRIGGHPPTSQEFAAIVRQHQMSKAQFHMALRLVGVLSRDQMLTLVAPRKGAGLTWTELVEMTSLEKWDALDRLTTQLMKERWGKQRFVDEARQIATTRCRALSGSMT
jgi:hypothetical protein